MIGKWALFVCGREDGAGRTYGLGSPPTEATRRLVGLYPTKRDAVAAMTARLAADDQEYADMRAGDGYLRPRYDVGRYDPTDYWPKQMVSGKGWGGSMDRAECHRANVDGRGVKS